MKENKNIVVMAWRDRWHPQYGGAEKYIMRICEYLVKNGFSIKYLTARYKGSKQREVIDGVEYIRIGNSITLYILAPLFYIFKLKNETELLIENYNAVPFNIPIYNKQNITIIHQLQHVEWITTYGKLIGNIASYVFNKLLFLVYKNEKNIVTVSDSTKQDLVENGMKNENISLVYNGVDTKVLDKVNKDNKVIKIISLGRVRATKHIEEAIEMIEYTVKELKINNILLNIAGTGEDEDRLKAITKEKNLTQYVKFLGYFTDDEKETLLTQAHLHVQFSRKEGWGITVIEAATKGTPTICYPVYGLIDSVSDKTGYFIYSTLKETWKEAMKDIKNNNKEYISKQNHCLEWSKKFESENQLNLFLKKVTNIVIGTVNTNVSTNKNIK